MTFKEFFQLSEAQGGSDKGLMGYEKKSSTRSPSDGQPFKNLSSIAGQEPRGAQAGGAAPSAPAFMRKKMKKN